MEKYFAKMQKEFGFEKREGQIKMAEIIENAILNDSSCVIEAGTGIGKTLAYLMPCVIDAKKNNKKVVISTNTINLQEQLIEKDLPLLEQILGEKIDFEIVKGRNNYICGNRLIKSSTNDELINWYKKTKTGDRSEIDFNISNDEWSSVCCDLDYCTNYNCAKTDNCYYYINRKKLVDKNVLIVNHSLLFSSFKFEGILPKYQTLILDEAHKVEAIARNYLEIKINSKDFFTNIGILHNSKTNLGYLKRITIELLNVGANKKLVDNIYLNMSETINSIYELFLNMANYLIGVLLKNNKYSVREEKVKSELTNYYDFIDRLKSKYILLLEFEKELRKLIENNPLSEDIVSSFFMNFNKMNEDLKNIFKIHQEKNDNNVNWFKYDSMYGNVEIISTPIDISSEFDEIFSDKLTILTSATLRVNNSYDYIKERLGLNSFEFYTVESPFDYDNNMRVWVSINDYNPNSDEYLDFVIRFIHKYLEKNDKGTFVLCTSYKQVEYIYDRLELSDFNILKQGEMSRTNLIDNFKNTDKSILIGTDSFWEGVDVKGEKLQNVIIVKLPFVAPDDPIVEAISEKMLENKKNPFMKYQLPLMITKLNQGVGRLIRSKTDSGDIIILDNRVYTKRYGKNILNSLPSTNIRRFGDRNV